MRLSFFLALILVSACGRERAGGELDLQATAALISDGKVKDGPALQKALNEGNKVDVDHDGTPDPLQVVERRDGEDRALEIRAIPSKLRDRKPDEVAVPLAVLELEAEGDHVELTARHLVTSAVVVAPLVIEIPATVVFCRWFLLVERPIFIGHFVVVMDVHHSKHKHKGKH
jgi:hypothetical protein